MKKEHAFLKRILSIMLSISMIVGLIAVVEPEKASEAQAAESTNLITNGGFETGALASGYSGATVVTSPTHSGNYAAKIDEGETMKFTTDGANGGALMDANKQYKLSAYVYAETDSTIQLFMPTWDTSWGNGQTGSDTYKTISVSANQWTVLEYYVPIKTYQSLSQPCFNNTSGGVMYIDDITLVEWNGEFDFTGLTVGSDGNLTLNYSSIPAGYYADSAMYYKFSLMVDGVEQTAFMETYNGNFVTWSTSWYNGSNVEAQSSILIPAGTLVQQADGSMAIVEGGKTLTTTENFYFVKQSDGTWVKTEYSNELTLSFLQIDGNNNWMFNRSDVLQYFLDGTYYKFDAYVDGVLKTLWLEFSGNETYIYAGVIGTPTESLRIPAGTILREYDAVTTQTVVDGGRELTLANTLYVEKSGDTWQESTWVPKVTFGFEKIDGGNWWITREVATDYDNTWYQAQVMVDGNEQTAWIEFISGYAYIYGHCFGGDAPTTSLLIEEGTVLYESAALGDKVTNGKELTLSEQFYVVCTDGTWAESVLSYETELGLSKVEVDNSWYFSLTDTSVLSTTYYKLPVILDGKATTVLAEKSGNNLVIWPSFFTVFDGSNSVPTSSLVIEKDTIMLPVDSKNGWSVMDSENEVTITNALDIVKANNAWAISQSTTDISIGYISSGSNNWQLSTDATIDSLTYYITTVTIDGKDVIVPIEKNGAGFIIWSNYFTLVDSNGAIPTEKFVIKEGAILQQIVPTSSTGWATPIANGQWYRVTNELEVLALGSGWGTYSEAHDTSATPIYYCIDNNMSYMVTSSAGAYEITKDGEEITSTELTEVGTYDITRIEQDTKFVQKVVLYKSGDAHADTTNTITSQDLVAVKKAALVENTNTLGEQFAADVNRSESVDAFDAKVMRRALVSDNAVAYLSKVKGNTSLNGEMPIIGFDGPSTDFLEGKDADNIYSMIKELGINTVLLNRDEIGTNYAWSSTQLALAEKYGLKLYLNNGYINDESNVDGIGSTLGDTAKTKVSSITSRYEGFSSFGGYFIEDEPMYDKVANNKKPITEFDVPLTTLKGYTNIHSYLNLAPYISGVINGQLGGNKSSNMSYENYKTYVEAAASAGVEALSYDMYLRGNGVVDGYWFWETTKYKIHTEDFWKNLDWMRTIADEDSNNNPFYAFVQVGNDFSSDNTSATATENLTTIQEMYFEANAALAMGAKGINYYSLVQPIEYVTSEDGSTDYTRSGLINYKGEANNGGSHGANYTYYDAAKKINAYIKAVDEVLMNATNTAVITTNTTVAGYLENEVSSYGSIASINNNEVLVGCFDYFGQEAFMVVNITPDVGNSGSSQSVTLTFDGAQSGQYIDMDDTAWQTMTSSGTLALTIPAGEAVVIVLD